MNKKITIKNKPKGIFFFITGLSGSGKSSLAKKIKPRIQKKYGKTLLFHGDEIRKMFALKKYASNDRKKIALQYVKLCKKITSNNINVILATVSLYKNKIKNVVGLTVKPEFPKNPNIIIKNDFKISIDKLSENLFKKFNNQ
jgi:adenylylsulfate kinase-like enzyme